MAEDRRTSERVPFTPAGRRGAAALHLLQTQQEPRYGGSTMQLFPQCVDNLALCGFAPKPGSDGARTALGCAAHEVAAEAAARAALHGAVSCGRAGGGWARSPGGSRPGWELRPAEGLGAGLPPAPPLCDCFTEQLSSFRPSWFAPKVPRWAAGHPRFSSVIIGSGFPFCHLQKCALITCNSECH